VALPPNSLDALLNQTSYRKSLLQKYEGQGTLGANMIMKIYDGL